MSTQEFKDLLSETVGRATAEDLNEALAERGHRLASTLSGKPRSQCEGCEHPPHAGRVCGCLRYNKILDDGGEVVDLVATGICPCRHAMTPLGGGPLK